MDPELVLAQLLSAAREIADRADDDAPHACPDCGVTFGNTASTLADGILALDEWLSKGGFLPQPWRRPAPTVHVLHWVHKHGADVFVFDNHEALVKQKAFIAREWYEREIVDTEVIAAIETALANEDWEAAGTLYAETMESYSLEFFQGFQTTVQSEAT